MKKSILLSFIVLFMATVFISCEIEDAEFKVVSVSPAGDATNVKIEEMIVVNFNKKPSAATITGDGINLISVGSGKVVPAIYNYDGDVTMTIFPSAGNFNFRMEFKLEIINATAEDGTVLAYYSSTLKTEEPVFKILSVTPANGSKDLKPDTCVVITYSLRPATETAYGMGASFSSKLSNFHSIYTDPKQTSVSYKVTHTLLNEEFKRGIEYTFETKGITSKEGVVLPDVKTTFTVEK
jgi:hypothetical protein